MRVGVTQFPVGLRAKDVLELKPDLVDACENLRIGTRMFARVMRIVASWYGNPKSEEVFPQIFDDAVFAWKSGEFEGKNVFLADDPGVEWDPFEVSTDMRPEVSESPSNDGDTAAGSTESRHDPAPASAEIRIDLSRIDGGK